MPKTGTRTYSRYTRQAVRLLGLQLHTRRLERGMTAAALAERAGVSRDLLYRVERGDPRVALGLAFELAAIVGVPLFDPCLLYTSPSPRDLSTSRMPSSA